MKCGGKTEGVEQQVGAFQDGIKIYKESKKTGTIYAHGFSQGGTTITSALKILGNKDPDVSIKTQLYGSATINNSSSTLGCNIVSRTDLIPLIADPLGFFIGIIRGTVTFTGSWFNIPFMTHRFEGPEYDRAYRESVQGN